MSNRHQAYRGDLEAATQRVAKLEEELARLPGLPRRTGTWIAASLIVFGSIVLTTVAVLALRKEAAKPARDDDDRPSIVPGETRLESHTARISAVGAGGGLEPIVADVNNDGVEDLVVAMSSLIMITYPSGGRSESRLHIVAIDGKTFARLWSTNPRSLGAYPTQMVKLGKRAILSAGGELIAIDLATGAVGDVRPLDMANTSLCATTDGRVLATFAAGGRTELQERVFAFDDALDASSRPSSSGDSGKCAPRGMPFCSTTESTVVYPCVSVRPIHDTDRMSSFTGFEEADFVLYVGDALGPPAFGEARPPRPIDLDPRIAAPHGVVGRDRPALYAEARSKGGDDRLLWHGPLSLPNENVSVGAEHHCYVDGKLFVTYRHHDALTLTAHDARSGALGWSASFERSRFNALACTSSRIYVFTNDRLYIHDARTGTSVHTVEEVKID